VFFVESLCEDPKVIAENIVVRQWLNTDKWFKVVKFLWFLISDWMILYFIISSICPQYISSFFIKLSQHSFLFFLCVWEQQVKLGSPDYTDRNTEEAIQDFMKRIKCYENSYQPLDENLDRSEIQFHWFPLSENIFLFMRFVFSFLNIGFFLQRVVIH